MKISNHPFGKTNLDKMTYHKSQKRRYFETGSDVIKTNKNTCIINFYHKVSDVKISRKTIEPFSRNPLHKNGKKKKLDTISLRATRRSSVRMASKLPNYVIHDFDNDIIRSHSSGGIIFHP